MIEVETMVSENISRGLIDIRSRSGTVARICSIPFRVVSSQGCQIKTTVVWGLGKGSTCSCSRGDSFKLAQKGRLRRASAESGRDCVSYSAQVAESVKG